MRWDLAILSLVVDIANLKHAPFISLRLATAENEDLCVKLRASLVTCAYSDVGKLRLAICLAAAIRSQR